MSKEKVCHACVSMKSDFVCGVCSDPVPPAGGEVLRYSESWDGIESDENGDYCDYAHVTRLQAEIRELRSWDGFWKMALELLPEEHRSPGGLIPGMQDLIDERERVSADFINACNYASEIEKERDELKQALESLNQTIATISKAVGDDTGLMWQKIQRAFLVDMPQMRELLELVHRCGMEAVRIGDAKSVSARIGEYLNQSAPAAKRACCDKFPKCVHGEGADGL